MTHVTPHDPTTPTDRLPDPTCPLPHPDSTGAWIPDVMVTLGTPLDHPGSECGWAVTPLAAAQVAAACGWEVQPTEQDPDAYGCWLVRMRPDAFARLVRDGHYECRTADGFVVSAEWPL